MNITIIAVSFVVAWATTRALLSLLTRKGILDVPNQRSLHEIPKPRGGGIGIIFGIATGLLLAWLLGLWLPGFGLLAGALLVAVVGFVDDRRNGLPVFGRLILQMIAASIAVWGTEGLIRLPSPEPLSISLGLLSLPAAVLWIVAVTNIYNFLDGIDGYAAVQGIIAGLGIALVDPSGPMAPIGLAVAGACGGFLLLNWRPARIFMGDVGSSALGFLLAAVPFQLNSQSRNGAVFAVAISLWFFLADGVFTIFRRLVRGEKIWEAHCSHIYQRLVKTGLNHAQVVTRVGAAAVLLTGAMVIAGHRNHPSGQWLVLVGAVCCFLVYCWWTLGREKALLAGEPVKPDVPRYHGLRSFWSWKLMRAKQLFLISDLLVLVAAFTLAYLLRFDFQIPRKELWDGIIQLPYVVIIQFMLLLLSGVYAFIWRYIGMAEMRVFMTAALWSALPVLMLRILLPIELQAWRVPLSVIFIDTGLAFGGVLGLRVVRRAVYERYQKRRKTLHPSYGKRESVLLIGAGRAGVMTAKEILSRSDLQMHIKGFVDDDPDKQASVIHGIKVLGTMQDLPRLVLEQKIDHVVITLAQASRKEFRRILDICREVPVKARIIPGLHEILQGRLTVSRIRDVQIEDLLGRSPVLLDQEHVQTFLTGKAVMVTGAGGSIGSELARQVARFQPSHLMMVERAEWALFNIDRELRAEYPDLNILTIVADIGDEERMRSVFRARCPHVLLHAAAHKHVPMMEANPCEAIKNNVLATRLLGQVAGEFGTEAFVMISTDKAVRPTSVMGAAKRIAELVVQDLNRQFPTRYLAVRFGNVIGSAGSVIPIFQEQIRKGGPVTVTHPDMLRYFMTIPEAAQLVLQAGAMGQGSEIFILDMGQPVRILDIAKETITLSGLKPFEDIDIVFTGLRAGEKLFEELEMTDEQMTKTRHPKIFIGKISPYPEMQVQHALHRLTVLSRAGRELQLRRFLNEILPEARIEVADDLNRTQEKESRLHLSASVGVS